MRKGNMREDLLSREVGWYPRDVRWPVNMREVDAAADDQLLEWYRFLPSAKDDLQKAMITRIIERLFSERRNA